MGNNFIPSISFPISLKTLIICFTIFIILIVGEPDLLDAIINLIHSFAVYLVK